MSGAFLSISCRVPSGEPLLFVVQDEFRGYQIELVEDSSDGIDVLLVDGAWVFQIPASGRLRIKSRRMLTVSHTESCRFESGRLCTVEALGTWWQDGSDAIDRWRFRPAP